MRVHRLFPADENDPNLDLGASKSPLNFDLNSHWTLSLHGPEKGEIRALFAVDTGSQPMFFFQKRSLQKLFPILFSKKNRSCNISGKK